MLSLCLLTATSAFAQNQLNRKLLDSLILGQHYKQAELELNMQLELIERSQLYDSLYHYPYYSGKIYLVLNSSETAVEKATALVNYAINKTENPRTHYRAWLNLANLFDDLGDNSSSLQVTQQALDIALKIEDRTADEIGKIRYNLGATQLALGNIVAAKKDFLLALKDYNRAAETPKNRLSDGYNAMGAVMWMSSKLDSAKVYYALAEQTIATAPGDPLENLYLSTVIKSNISLLSYSQNDLSSAVKVQNEVIRNYQKVIDSLQDENIVSQARRYQLRALKNLSVFYNEQGNLKKASEILSYVFKKEQKLLEPGDLELITSRLQIGQALLSLKEFEQAKSELQQALLEFDTYELEAPYWRATTYHALAQTLVEMREDKDQIRMYFDKAEGLFKESLGAAYDTEFLGFLRNKANFLAAEGYFKEALKTAMDGQNYLKNQKTDFSIPRLKSLLNLGEISQLAGDLQQASIWYDRADKLIGNSLSKSTNAADSLQYVFYKPQLVLSQSKLSYTQTKTRDAEFLKTELDKLKEVTQLLALRKTTVFKKEDVNNLLQQYGDIAEFAKKLALESYQLTKDETELNLLIELHESAIYNRIRTRLNLKNDIAFARVPDSVKSVEKTLKNKISSLLANQASVNDFLDADQQWKAFLNALKENYPDYYQLRYGKIKADLSNLKQAIPAETSVVRYIFIEDRLVAVVITADATQLVDLGVNNWSGLIGSYDQFYSDFMEFSKYATALYDLLWKPLADKIETDKLIVIPDRELFNLNFEILTPKQIARYEDMGTESLLAKHTISYNYSLLLINQIEDKAAFDRDFVGFAPGFSDSMKQKYLDASIDSLDRDEAYLRLLPQPAISELTKNYAREFSGEVYLNTKASKRAFKTSADGHKIIQIGTHAQSDNVSPILSRLIFAKTSAAQDNSLYTYEIYNLDLKSQLAILTACETGKPRYQAGEGMISLAHAFNYAGSNAILTSLWKIDETATTQIMQGFYENLSTGQPKDLALKMAKLDYLTSAPQRATSPDYWAGLVLLGDTGAIDLTTSSSKWLWFLAVTILVLIFGMALYFRKNRP